MRERFSVDRGELGQSHVDTTACLSKEFHKQAAVVQSVAVGGTDKNGVGMWPQDVARVAITVDDKCDVLGKILPTSAITRAIG